MKAEAPPPQGAYVEGREAVGGPAADEVGKREYAIAAGEVKGRAA